jgi:CRISPR-associated protein Csm3
MQFYAPDNPIVRNARGEPIIPGSSLKGVMRSNLDAIHHKDELKKVIIDKPLGDKKRYGALVCDKEDCWVCRVFGRPANRPHREPTRLRVEDCLLDGESVKELGLEDARAAVSVVRTENAILRFFGAANPRRSEYVPAGVRFSFRLLYDVYMPQDPKKGMPLVLEALHHVEDSGIGGSRSRGTGRVKFERLHLYWKSVKHYESGDRNGKLLAGPVDDVAELQKMCREKLSELAQELEKGEQGD